MATQLNPFQAPIASPVVVSDNSEAAPILFHGSMTLEEGNQVEQLLQRKKISRLGKRAMWVYVNVAAALLVSTLALEAIVYDELDQLFNIALGAIVMAAVLIGTYVGNKQKKQQIADLKTNEAAVFARVTGRIHASGVDFLAEDFPVEYAWEDFMGYRADDEVALLFVEYPTEFNFLAASWFASAEDWATAKHTVETHLQRLPQPLRKIPQANSRMTHIVRGTHLLNQRQWKDALAEFDQALEIDRDHIQAHRGRGIAFVGLLDFEHALEAIAAAVQHGANDASTRRIRATALVATDQYEPALDDLNWLLELSADDSNLLRDRGLCMLKTGRLEEALRDLTAALQSNPQDAVAYNNRGATLLEMGRADDAVIDLEKAIEIEPEFERPHVHLAKAKEMPGRS